jgi:hypothetical protein
MNDNEMEEFVKFDRSLPKRFHKLSDEIENHFDKCWKCRIIPFYYCKEVKEKMIICSKIIDEKRDG